MRIISNRYQHVTYKVVQWHEDFEDAAEYTSKYSAVIRYRECHAEWASNGYPEDKEPQICKCDHDVFIDKITDDVEEFFRE